MKTNFLIIFFLVSELFLLPSFASAAPSIERVTGVIANGLDVTVSGAGFGFKSPVAPYHWNQFDIYAVDTDLETIGYVNGGAPDGATVQAYVKSANSYSGGQSARVDYHRIEGQDIFPQVALDISGNNNQIYVSHMGYWDRYLGTGNFDNFVFKLSRGGSKPYYSGVPAFHDTHSNNNGVVNYGDTGFSTYSHNYEYGNDGYLNPGASSGSWHRHEYEYKLSTPGVADGNFLAWVDGLPIVNFTNVITREVSESNKHIEYVMTPFDGVSGLDSSQGFYLCVDDYYVDITQARVEICSGLTWANKGTCEIQIPHTSWVDANLQITINQGIFDDLSTKYLYVVDSTGVANANGYEITFGSGSSDTTPPACPSGLAVI